MALRASTMACAAASKPPTGLIGVLASLKERLATGKLLRPDVADDVLRLPMEQSKYRTPAPGDQRPTIVPTGPYKNVFDIAYFKRGPGAGLASDASAPASPAASPLLSAEEAKSAADLPPTPGRVPVAIHLGYAGEFDKKA
ncbi:hypothetical protein BU14_0785s0005 [Porphyra umbilicalis]|uniref:NADH dehydrogenase [ubiquinone] 1 alpha subcomplex subunit 7 n=1 Tax=Porphyra umbilicalis TaxID=2786 RepID=A0A1X6NNY7_PORUM|nr:hypothetical protein BU14_0785s0005 [Porphyra umbilicalis]|eukprot:OSX70328.1 hypothetical protein BU14_0785s0005 [Porphyra umbilicalis]